MSSTKKRSTVVLPNPYNKLYFILHWGPDSALSIAIREIFRAGTGAQPASYKIGTRSFPGVKRPGRGVDNPLLSSA
jgi:hypothetical protein